MDKIGVIGLGRMGAAIARRLVAQGYETRGWTRSGRATEGVETTADLSELVKFSDVLILSLLDDSAVAEVLDSLLAFNLAGKLILDTSTVVPDVLSSRIAQITEQGAAALDAPISGGPELVAAGKCGIFIGGEAEAVTRATPVFEALSGRVFHVGPLGAGLAMKVVNNSMLQIYFAGLAELMPMAQRAGLPLETVLRILCGGPAGMPMVADRIPKILGEDPEVGFALSAAVKDVDVFRRVVASYGLESPVLGHFQALVTRADEAGFGEHDPAVLVKNAYDSGAKS